MTLPVAKLRRCYLVPVLILGAGTLLSACGSGSTASPAAVKSACEKVAAALSDGPDPSADPVGYAEAQIRPLGKIRVDDPPLQKAINKLDSAYKSFFDANGVQLTATPLTRALKDVASFCPEIGQ
jgi:hypothetical protein